MAEPQQPRYEQRDVSVVGIGIGALAILVGFVFVLLFSWLVLSWGDTDPGPEPPLLEQAPPVPEPRLQVSPQADLQEFMRRKTARLQSYGWVDRDAGIAHIPIDRAMQVLIEHGVPRWQAAAADARGTAEHARQQARSTQGAASQ